MDKFYTVEDNAHDAELEAIESEFKEIEVLNEQSVLKLSGADNLDLVESLSFGIDTTTEGLAHLGQLVPNLRELVLDGSHLVSFRDFGTSLTRLEILHLRNSRVCDLDGIGALCTLRELYVDDNTIEDLTPLAMHDTLELLSLRNNKVHEFSEIDQLGTCRNLRFLTLADNPVCNVDAYRRIVFHSVPSLFSLDGEEIVAADRRTVREDVLRDAERLVEQLWNAQVCRDSEAVTEETETESVNTERLAQIDRDLDEDTDSVSLSSSRRDIPTLGSMKQCTRSFNKDSLSSSSTLTHGSDVVIAGNLAASMRRRRAGGGTSSRKSSRNRRSAKCAKDPEEVTIMDGFHKTLQDLSERSRMLESDLVSLREEISVAPSPQRRRRYRKAANQDAQAVVKTPRGKGPAIH